MAPDFFEVLSRCQLTEGKIMSRSSASKHGKVGATPGEHAVQIGTDWIPVRPPGAKTRKSMLEKNRASVFLPKAGRALNKPGIGRSTVFSESGNPKVCAYSACADQPGKTVRESTDGRKTVGSLVGGKFKALARKKAGY